MARTSTRPLKKARVTPAQRNGNGHAPEKTPPVDLASLYRKRTIVLSIPDFRADDQRDTGIRIEVASSRSEEALQVLQEYRNKAQGLPDEEKDALITEAIIRQLIVVTKNWWHEGETTNAIYYNGALLPCTDENKRMLYTTDGWQDIRDFVIVGYTSHADFFGEPPKTA